MDKSLVSTLVLFAVYSIVCVLPLWNSFKSTKRSDLLINGTYLIFFASFVLTGLALVTGVAEGIVGDNKLTKEQTEQISGFMQYIIFASFLVTLLFGAVGANIFSSGLLNDSNAAILNKLKEIENKIERVQYSVEASTQVKQSNWISIKIIGVVGALLILYWKL